MWICVPPGAKRGAGSEAFAAHAIQVFTRDNSRIGFAQPEVNPTASLQAFSELAA